MPFYEYQCSNCGNQLEELQKMSDPPLTKCPKCGKETLKRLIGTGGGIIFKGSGFYLTDYKKKSKPTGENISSSSDPGSTASAAASPSKPTTKKDSKKKDK